MKSHTIPVLLVTVGLALLGPRSASAQPTATGERIVRGLQVLYDFADPKGDLVRDRSGVGEPLNLAIEDAKLVTRRAGSLRMEGRTTIRSNTAATKITDAVKRTGEITLEAWIRPGNATADGPARIVTISHDTSSRNVTLGQEKNLYDVRLRTSKRTTNGLPSVNSPGGSLTAKPTHVVYTRNGENRARLYLNGNRVADQAVDGDLRNWDGAYRLALGNELTGDRPWPGTYYLVALYDRALTPGEVERNFAAGPGSDVPDAPIAARPVEPANATESAKLFESDIAAILATHCLECHDSRSRQGHLDLSRQVAALLGGENGRVVHRNEARRSSLWTLVESDEMPQDRPPLSAAEKTLLKRWIDTGAVWTLDVIDAEEYARERNVDGNWLRRLTVPEYVETVRVAVGVDIGDEARRILPPDLRADGFTNTAYNLNVDLSHVSAYAELAGIVVARMDVPTYVSTFANCRELNDACVTDVVRSMGKWLLRGPLDDREVESYVAVARLVGKEGGTFDEAVTLVIEAMLQSPRFVYRVENQRGDGEPRPVGDFELASRLGYIVWGAPPDRELLRAAEAGELRDEGNIRVQLRRMLRDPRAIQRSKQFMGEWLNLDRLHTLQPNAKSFPTWNAELAEDMRAETLAFFEEVAWKRERPLAELLNAQVVFATPRLAEHYGLRPAGEGLQRYDVSGIPARGGLLTQGSVLTIGGDDASMVARGLFVLTDLLRGRVQDPPPCVDTTPVATKTGLTQRVIAEQRIANASCGGCHVKFEPLAFGLEKYNGIGAFHDRDEHGNPLRDDGRILFPGAEETVEYENAAQLFDLLAESERVRQCLTWKIAQFSLGRPLGKADADAIAAVDAEASEKGGTYSAVITALCASDLVRKTRTEVAAEHVDE